MSYSNRELVTDLNEEPSNFGFLPNTYHCIDEETTNVVVNCTPSSKNTPQRQENFSIEEDKLLVSAWLNISLDPVKVRDQKVTQFWKRIAHYFEENKKWSNERSEKSLTNRWNKISKEVSKFCGHYADIDRLQRSGYTEHDKVAEAKEKFKAEMNHAFVLDHCWVILKFQQKWMDESKKMDTKRKLKPSSKITNSYNLEEGSIKVEEPTILERPTGRKAAKEVINKAKNKEQNSENDATSKTFQLLEELKAKRLENEHKRNEQFELLLATEQKQLALKEKEIAIQVRNEDAKIMALDTSGMSSIQAEYFTSLQKEILAKRACTCDM